MDELLGLGGGDEEHNSEESERDWTMGCWGNLVLFPASRGLGVTFYIPATFKLRFLYHRVAIE